MATATKRSTEPDLTARERQRDDRTPAERPAGQGVTRHGGLVEPAGTAGRDGAKSAASEKPQPRPSGRCRAAAERATQRDSVVLTVPYLGTLKVPAARDELAFLGGVGTLAVLGVLDWPVAAVLGTGHVLAMNRRNKTLHAFGEALEEA